MKKVFFILAVSLAVSGIASASIVPMLSPSTPSCTSVGMFMCTYTYSVNLDNLQRIDVTSSTPSGPSPRPASDYFMTIYDFNGLIGTPTFAQAGGLPVGASFTVNVQSTGRTPLFQLVPDDPTLPNIVLTYTGSVNIPTTPSGVLLGVLTAKSQFGPVTQTLVTASAAANDAPGSPGDNSGSYKTTFTNGPTGVPEPASLVLIGSGLIGLAFLRRRFAQAK